MKALSIKQPWAWLICKGFKDVENRDWATKFRGRIYVHAGVSKSEMDKETLAWILKRLNNKQAAQLGLMYERLSYGAIIGEVDIVDCVAGSDSPWWIGPYCFILANPVLYEKPIPYRGQLGFFEVKLS